MLREDDEKEGDQLKLEDVTDYSPVSIQLGYGLVEMVDDDSGGPLVERITGIRKQVSKALGFIIPAVRIRDDLTLASNQYRIRIGQTIVGDDVVYPDRKLAIPGDETNIKLEGIEVKRLIVAYEPIWAIGTGKTCEANEANRICGLIRKWIGYEDVIIQYGGSVKSNNIDEIMSMSDIDGVLVGGASLDPTNFARIANYEKI